MVKGNKGSINEGYVFLPYILANTTTNIFDPYELIRLNRIKDRKKKLEKIMNKLNDR